MSRFLPRAVLVNLLIGQLALVDGHAAGPFLYWSAEPVKPGELAMLQGAWSGEVSVTLEGPAGEKRKVRTVTSNHRSLRFEIPDKWPDGIYSCEIRSGEGTLVHVINAPDPWWIQGDRGRSASPGGWVRIFGRCLGMTPIAGIELRGTNQRVELAVHSRDTWTLGGHLPSTVSAGRFEVWVNNGYGGSNAAQRAGEVIVETPALAESRALTIEDFGGRADDEQDDSIAFRAALEAVRQAGGGAVRLGRGRYRLKGNFDLPSGLHLSGEGSGSSYLAWEDTDSPPAALLTGSKNLVLEDLAILAFNYRKGLVAGNSSIAANDVILRRVRLRFAPMSARGLGPEKIKARETEATKTSVVDLAGHDLQVIDCDLAFPAGIGFSLAGEDLVFIGNIVHAETFGTCAFGGGRRALVERNAFQGCTISITRTEDLYFASNSISHVYRNFREALTTDGCGGGPGDLKVKSVSGMTMEVEAPAFRSEPPIVRGAVRIQDGTGAGQWRTLVSFDGRRLELDRPWDVMPDATSAVVAGNAMRHHLIVNNSMSDAGVAVQLFGGALECVVAGNRSTRAGGYRIWGRQDGPGSAPAWYVQLLDNRIPEATGIEGPEAAGGTSSIDIVGDYGSPIFHGTTVRGILVRGNELAAPASLNVRRRVHDVVVQHNRTSHPPFREMKENQFGVLIDDETGR